MKKARPGSDAELGKLVEQVRRSIYLIAIKASWASYTRSGMVTHSLPREGSGQSGKTKG